MDARFSGNLLSPAQLPVSQGNQGIKQDFHLEIKARDMTPSSICKEGKHMNYERDEILKSF